METSEKLLKVGQLDIIREGLRIALQAYIDHTGIPVHKGTAAQRAAYQGTIGELWLQTDGEKAPLVFIHDGTEFVEFKTGGGILVGTEADRLAITGDDLFNGLQFNQVNQDNSVHRYLYAKGEWILLPSTEYHDEEQVIVQLQTTSVHVIDFTDMVITVVNNTQSTTHTYNADEIGRCVFYVPIGDNYTIQFPSVSGYTTPASLTFVSEEYIRNVTATYIKSGDVRDISRGFILEKDSNPALPMNGVETAVDEILNAYGSYVIDEVHKKYARLSSLDHRFFADGTPWSGTYGNSFRRLAKHYTLREVVSEGTRYYVSPDQISAVERPETWIGTYLAALVGNKIVSRPNQVPLASKTMSEFFGYAQNIHSSYGLYNYFDWQKIFDLYCAKYGNLNSQSVIGRGLSDGGQAYYTASTGATRQLGDGSGEMPYDANYNEVKLFGIEDLWGHLWQFCPNCRFSGNNAIIYEGNQVSNTAQGIRTFARLASASGEYVTKRVLGEYLDLIPTAIGGSEVTHYCDGAWASSSGELLLVGGASNVGSLAGISFASSDSPFSYSSASIGARLAFRGDISEYEEITGAAMADLNS